MSKVKETIKNCPPAFLTIKMSTFMRIMPMFDGISSTFYFLLLFLLKLSDSLSRDGA